MSTRQPLTLTSLPITMPYGAHLHEGEVRINNASNLARHMRPLAKLANFGNRAEQAWAQWLIRELSLLSGIYPASLHNLYGAMARGELPKQFTLPAINLRGLTFDLALAAFRQAKNRNAGAIIFELARSEKGYTGQNLRQYAASIFAAAIAAGWTGPVFVQGDHFQIKASKFATDPDDEVRVIQDLILEAFDAWIYNIDVDTSTLVDLSQRTLRLQQRANAVWTAHFLNWIRANQPIGVHVSVGGEIGEVGMQNSTTRELIAYMTELELALGRKPDLSKISIQTGTRHGGIKLPDGSMAPVQLDTRAMRLVGNYARDHHEMIIVQHGASTSSDKTFPVIRIAGAGECHLATDFMTRLLDNVPLGIAGDMKRWLLANGHLPKEKQTEAQWWHDVAKQALGAHSQAIWSMPEWNRGQAVLDVERRFELIFEAFDIADTAPLVAQFAPLTYNLPNPRPDETGELEGDAPTKIADDVSGLAD